MDLLSRRLAAFVALGVVITAAPAFADLFSPGPLARPHQKLEGLSQCTRCHPAGSQLSQAACLSCHTELAPQIQKGTGFHGHLSNAERECQSCHKEHQGRDFQLVDWGAGGEKGFDHKRTGWALKGKHEQVKCQACHDVRLIVDPAARALINPPLKATTYLGLSTACRSCHADEHRGQESQSCEKCHVESSWTKTPAFNHQATDFPLLGKHRQVACAKCHPQVKDEELRQDAFPKPLSETFMRLTPVAHTRCADCHEDPHDGKFGPACESCHTVNGWKIVHGGLKDITFHDKTRYPLEGLHRVVPCEACHGPFKGIPAKFRGIPFGHCSDCHLDAHEGQLKVARGQTAPPCEKCHSVAGFLPVAFALADHQKTDFPLLGAHVAVACNLCHVQQPKLKARISEAAAMFVKRRNRPLRVSLAQLEIPASASRCEVCHADPHARQFVKEDRPQPCQDCHRAEAWTQLHFDHDKDSRFPLTGKHAEVPCAGCHRAEPSRGGEVVRYRNLATTCAGCHADPHAGQFEAEKRACESCHQTSSWRKLTFVHAPPFTSYLLEGAHQKVACEGCHAQVSVAKDTQVRRYRPLPTACEECHADFHHGEFKRFLP